MISKRLFGNYNTSLVSTQHSLKNNFFFLLLPSSDNKSCLLNFLQIGAIRMLYLPGGRSIAFSSCSFFLKFFFVVNLAYNHHSMLKKKMSRRFLQTMYSWLNPRENRFSIFFCEIKCLRYVLIGNSIQLIYSIIINIQIRL